MDPQQRADELVAAVTAAGVRATADPVTANPPCVLVTPPRREYDTYCGYTATWQLVALAAGPASRQAWRQLDIMLDALDGPAGLDIAAVEPIAYELRGESTPAYLITLTDEGINTS